MISARDAALRMVQDDRAAANDAAVRASAGGSSVQFAMGGFDQVGRRAYEARKAAERRKKYAAAGITPEMEKRLRLDLETAGSGPESVRFRSQVGPGWDDYRTTAALDALAAGSGFDPTRWGLPEDYVL